MLVIKNRLTHQVSAYDLSKLNIYLFVDLRKLEILEIPKSETNLAATTPMKNYFGN